MRVLVVDAPPLARPMIEAASAARGHDLVLVDDATLPALVGSATPSVVVAFGVEAVGRARAAAGGGERRAAAIVILGIGAPALALLDAGADDVMPEPASTDELTARLVVVERRVREREDLGESEMRARVVFRSKMLGMAEWRRDGGFDHANDHLLSMIGYSREELEAGRVNWRAMTPAEYRPAEERAHRQIAELGYSYPIEKEYIRKDGRRVPILIAGVAFEGTRDRGFAFMVDISDRKRAEDQLRESNERFEIVARATSDAVWDWDIASGTVVWNQSFHTLFGYERPEVETGYEWWADKLHPEDRAGVIDGLDKVVAGGGRTWSAEYRFRAADGRWVHVADQGTFILGPDGRAVRGIGSMKDITERVQMQERLLLADRLASIGTLAAGVAHEINNPLSHVVGNLDLAVRHLRIVGSQGGGAVPAALEALADAQQGAERVRSIVRDLRTFSRVDVARLAPVDVRKPLDWAARVVTSELAPRARLVMSPGPVPLVQADESRLGQVFVNLLVNAAQAIPEGDPLHHEVRVTAESRHHDGRAYVVVSIADTGVGIPAEARGRIFDPFFTTKDVGVGTGLGLSICHGIVSSLGGSIEVESEPGRGSIFRVVLPEGEGRERPPPAEPTGPSLARRGKVLVVDDDALMRALLERTLGLDHDVVSVTSAEEALALVAGGARFDVLFSDIMMPSMTGMDLHAALRSIAPEQAARIVFLTAGVYTPQAQRFLQEVENPWLEKPFDPEELRAFTRRRMTGS